MAIKNAIDNLLERQLLTSGKYLVFGKRQLESFVRDVPENIQNRTHLYLLQWRLLDFDVNVNEKIESLKYILV